MMEYYKPYPSNDNTTKFYIITNQGKKIRFGAKGYEHYTEGHLDVKRRDRYLNRHKKRENWNDPNTSGYWAAKYLWLYPTYNEAYKEIKKELRSKGLI